jgi:hypothetical protein
MDHILKKNLLYILRHQRNIQMGVMILFVDTSKTLALPNIPAILKLCSLNPIKYTVIPWPDIRDSQ